MSTTSARACRQEPSEALLLLAEFLDLPLRSGGSLVKCSNATSSAAFTSEMPREDGGI